MLLTGSMPCFSILASSKVVRVLEVSCELALKEFPTESLHALSLAYEKKRIFMQR